VGRQAAKQDLKASRRLASVVDSAAPSSFKAT
jgi:hypothetical protein